VGLLRPADSVGDVNLSLLQHFSSGTRSSAEGSIDPTPYVANPSYIDPPDAVDYFFTRRGALETDDVTRTDLAVNYSLRLFGKQLELFVQPEVLNLFNERAVVAVDEEVLTSEDVSYLKPFNPFTETPVECPQGAAAATCEQMGAHWQKGQNFGQPTSEASYQLPRTFRVSVGVRF
jgi:hypothetical protein